MRNMGTENPELSGASYELLSAVVGSFDLDASPILTTKGESRGLLSSRLSIIRHRSMDWRCIVSIPRVFE